MMSIGWLEMVIVLFAALVFLKPEEIPRFFRMLGRIYGQAFGIYQQVMRQINLSDVDFSYYDPPLDEKRKNVTTKAKKILPKKTKSLVKKTKALKNDANEKVVRKKK